MAAARNKTIAVAVVTYSTLAIHAALAPGVSLAAEEESVYEVRSIFLPG
jgi:hypothetical protein